MGGIGCTADRMITACSACLRPAHGLLTACLRPGVSRCFWLVPPPPHPFREGGGRETESDRGGGFGREGGREGGRGGGEGRQGGGEGPAAHAETPSALDREGGAIPRGGSPASHPSRPRAPPRAALQSVPPPFYRAGRHRFYRRVVAVFTEPAVVALHGPSVDVLARSPVPS